MMGRTLEEIGAVMERMEQAERLVSEARRLRAALDAAYRAGSAPHERLIRLLAVRSWCDDRISRREYCYRCAADEAAVVTTANIIRWLRGRIDVYARFGEVDAAEIAGDACNAFGLWDARGSIPPWVWGLCERVGPRAAQEAMRQRAFFVEKKINYTEDGDVLFA